MGTLGTASDASFTGDTRRITPEKARSIGVPKLSRLAYRKLS